MMGSGVDRKRYGACAIPAKAQISSKPVGVLKVWWGARGSRKKALSCCLRKIGEIANGRMV